MTKYGSYSSSNFYIHSPIEFLFPLNSQHLRSSLMNTPKQLKKKIKWGGEGEGGRGGEQIIFASSFLIFQLLLLHGSSVTLKSYFIFSLIYLFIFPAEGHHFLCTSIYIFLQNHQGLLDAG